METETPAYGYLMEWQNVPQKHYVLLCSHNEGSAENFSVEPGEHYERHYLSTSKLQGFYELQLVAKLCEVEGERFIAINPQLPPAFTWMKERLERWMDEASAWTDILLALGNVNPNAWTGPAFKNNRKAALSVLLNRKVKAAECGVNALREAIEDRIKPRGDCMATRQEEIAAFLRVAQVVCRIPV